MGPIALSEFVIALFLMAASLVAFTTALLTLRLINRYAVFSPDADREKVKCVLLGGTALILAMLFAGDVLWMLNRCLAFDRAQQTLPVYHPPAPAGQIPCPRSPAVQPSTLAAGQGPTSPEKAGPGQPSPAARTAVRILKRLVLKKL